VRLAGLAGLLVFASVSALAAVDAHLAVSGTVREVDGELELAVVLTNRAASPMGPVTAEAELLGHRGQASLKDGLPAAATGHLVFRLPLEIPQPGVYPITLLLDYSVGGDSPSPALSQRAFLLVALGAQAEAPVRISVPDLRLRSYGKLQVSVQSADGTAHHVRLRAEPPRGLRALEDTREVDVPAQGAVLLELGLLRSGAPRGPQGLLVIAESSEGAAHRTAVATGTVDVLPDDPWLPRLRGGLAITAGLLFGASLLAELRRRRRPREG